MISATNTENNQIFDPIFHNRLMTDAVTILPCEHVFSNETILNLASERCPLDGELFFSISPNLTVRNHVKVLFFESADKGFTEQLELFIDGGMDVDVTNDSGWTALIFAACRGHFAAVQILLRKRANPNVRDESNATPLMWASRNGFLEIMISLLDAGAEINATDGEGRTALMLAARGGKLEAVRTLLEREADPSIEVNGTQAIDFARAKNHDEVVTLLEEKGSKK